MWSITYGTVPDRERFLSHCAARLDDDGESNPVGAYPMEIVNPIEWEAIKAAVNQGIDSHLEAVAFSGADIVPRSTRSGRVICNAGHITISDPGSLHTLIRRLVEAADCGDPSDNENPPVLDLVSSVLYTLGIEWV